MELLEPFMIEERASKFTKIIENRIFGIVPVVEGLYDLGNVAAVCRTVEGLGIGKRRWQRQTLRLSLKTRTKRKQNFII